MLPSTLLPLRSEWAARWGRSSPAWPPGTCGSSDTTSVASFPQQLSDYVPMAKQHASLLLLPPAQPFSTYTALGVQDHSIMRPVMKLASVCRYMLLATSLVLVK
ncbi:hypothetical protein CONLIGDRAFT_14080 [Coniochaeta ligniaria NRRL 30616]|uniref:Uncharacterized protein n=1 Tax=Coniochaeta ligniaria NRRL 30616 TaxID=1408157 RepID=A0A1J7K379_9PEZI|nr:hypothetical protein CONLIGDRAFT_14080 [Coniochaeta ligniaria NRRL 30616]